MYIRIVTTYCNKEHKLIGKEAHLDNFKREENVDIIESCMEILNKKLPQIEKMFPPHLKNQDFEIIFHGEFLASVEYTKEIPGIQAAIWKPGELVFNVKQMGTPEAGSPTIITT